MACLSGENFLPSLVTTFWLIAMRFAKRRPTQFAASGLAVLFGLNILEAVAVDFATFQLASIMNAASGILLFAAMGNASCTVHRDGRFADLEFEGLGRAWILAFTFWNLTFLLINYPIIVGHHLAVLGVPLLVGLCKPRLWLQARLSLLALDLMAFATFPLLLIPWFDTSGMGDLHWEIYAAATSLFASLLVHCLKFGTLDVHNRWVAPLFP